MALNLNAVSVLSAITPTPVAPLIEGAAAATRNSTTTMNLVNSAYFSFGSSLTGRYGMRCNLAAALDFTGHDFVTFAVASQTYNVGGSLDTVANGGIRIIFVDGSGNYAGYNIYGSLPLYSPEGAVDGFLAHYNTNNIAFSIARTRVPDISSGTLNWANITAIETTIKTVANVNRDFHLSRLVKRSVPVCTGTETLRNLASAAKGATSTIHDPLLIKEAPLYHSAASQSSYNLRLGLTVGNGSTPTNLTETAFAVGFETLFEFSPGAASHGPWVQLDAARTRPFKIVQSASDVLSLTDGSLAAAGGWQWELSGTGVATCTRVQFWRFNGFIAGHGTYTECVWDGGSAPVQVAANTVISTGNIRNATAAALRIIGVAGNYSTLSVRLNNPAATADIELGAGGAGTYNLAGITVPSGYTLKLRNNSATNAITVAIPAGMAYSTSTAGGSITVSTPTVYVDITAPALVSGSRVQLYNITDSTEIYNDVLAGTGLTLNLAYTANKVIRLRADHATKLPLETSGVLTSTGLTFLDIQAEDTVYLLNGIDGSTVTEFAPDGPNIEVDINDPDGITNIQRLYAWMQYYMTTAPGIASVFFGAMSAIDAANYSIDQSKADIKLDNVTASPLRVVGGYLARKDGTTVIAPLSGSIQLDPGKAYPIETGVSGLTTDESNKLNQISLLATETTASAAKTAADLAASRAAVLLALPQAPSAATVGAAVWADPAAATVATEITALEAKANAELAAFYSADVQSRPIPPTASAVAGAVWADPTAANVATETTAALAASRAAELLSRPAAPTQSEITAAVWADSRVDTLALEVTAQAALDNTEDLLAVPAPTTPPTAGEVATAVWAAPGADAVATEVTAQKAVDNAALAAALSA